MASRRFRMMPTASITAASLGFPSPQQLPMKL